MNREIRFRAFDKETGIMIDDYAYPALDGGISTVVFHRSSPIQCPEWEIMQFTGLKDKNGTPIYEGDIIAIDFCNNHYGKRRRSKIINCEVVFKYGSFTIKWPEGDYDVLFNNWWDRSVIGNIHQHPELLKPKS